jgi:hypothetical protein
MKKIALLITAVAVCGLLVSPVSGQEKCEFGPYYMTVSNTQGCVPDGEEYAGVSIDTCPETLAELFADEICANGEEPISLITVDPDDDILIPGSNYGIQRFGLNYRRDDPENLDIVVVQLNGSYTVQPGWKIAYQFDDIGKSFGPFGVFTYDDQTVGNNRQNPLQFVLCYSGEYHLSVYDFYVLNDDEYMFAAHIAGFIGRSCDSALFALPVPLVLVELADFRAVGLPGTVIVKWTTASEIDNAGFNLYRADSVDGEYVQINAGLIPPKGSPTSSSTYLYFDADVERGKTYYYKLEDVDLYGEKAENGPVSASTRIFGPGK